MPEKSTQHRATHFPGKQRFELRSGSGEPAVLSYPDRDENIVMDHTYVPAQLRGQGIAAAITRDALLEARRLGWKIVPDCSYVETFILRNPEFADLLAR
ncbi:N-acetyltransferase [Akkermansiaceae bacterium]|nr:N-acetyltransferase [Akkermansiaceae bacterium]